MFTSSPSRRSWAIRAVSSLFNRQRSLTRAERLRRKAAAVEELEDRALLATFEVTSAIDGTVGSLRQQILAANGTAEPDIIVFNIPLEDQIPLVQGAIAIDEELTIEGTNLATGNEVVINAGGNSRAFYVEATTVAIQELTITGGQSFIDPDADPVDIGDGGAIWSVASDLTLNQVTVANNSAVGRGGGIFVNGGSLTLSSTTVSGNRSTAGGGGGGISTAGGSHFILDSRIENNRANVGFLNMGGHGGGINATGGGIQVTRTTVSNNFAGGDGGGIFNNATFLSDGSTWSGNLADNGGGIYNNDGRGAEIRNSTISQNEVEPTELPMPDPGTGNEFINGFGGGIYNDSGPARTVLTLTNSTVTQNVGFQDVGTLNTERGGGVYNEPDGGEPGELRVFNTIVAGNQLVDAGGFDPDFPILDDIRGAGADGLSQNNIIGDAASSGSILDGVQGNIVGVGDPDTFLDPILTNNGGPTFTHALVPRGIAVNAGENSRAAEAGIDLLPEVGGADDDQPLANDQRGANPFLRIFEDIVDIGAYEVQPFVVDTLSDISDGDFSPGEVSLREAIEIAELSPVEDSIAFAIDGVFDPVIVIGDQFVVTTDITIFGRNVTGGGFVTVDGDNDGRILHVDGMTPDVAPVVILEDLTFTNGHANGSDLDAFPTLGGAILNEGASVELYNSGVLGNEADGSGGGIANIQAAVLTTVNTTISGNTAGFQGGGVYNEQSLYGSVNSTITLNESGLLGGGIASPADPLTETRLYNSIVAGNVAAGLLHDLSGQSIEDDAASNLIGSAANAGGVPHGVRGNIVGNDGLGSIDITTVLAPEATKNGGGHPTHVLVPGSLALDNGDNGRASRPGIRSGDIVPEVPADLNDEPLLNDARNAPFTRFAGGTTDIGAYEDQVLNIRVDTSVDELDADFTDLDFSLREAVLLVNQNPGLDFIGFEDLGPSPRVFVSDQLVVTSDVYIDGSTPDGDVVLDGLGNGRIFLVDAFETPVTDTRFSNLTFTNGSANGSDGGLTPESGGAILSRFATVQVSNSTFTNNSALDSGGAYYNEDGVLSVIDSTFTNNSAGILGGGIANDDGAVDVLTSTFFANDAEANGGAIFNNNGPLSVVNSTVSANSANVDGGGIYNEDDTVVIVNTTIVNNIADADDNGTGDGGGLLTVDDNVTFTNLFNSLFAGNQVGSGAGDLGGKTPEPISSNNFVADTASSAGLIDGVNGNIVGIDGAGTVPVADVVDPIRSNGGPVQTHSLNPTSPAINTGDSNRAAIPGTDLVPDVADGDVALVQDQRGFPFSRISGGVVDIGAYEVISTWIVDTDSDVDNGDYTAGDLSLREALSLANATPAMVTIQFDIPVANPTIAVGDELFIDTDVVIDGTNINALGGSVTLDGEGVGRILKIDGDITPATVGLTNLTFVNGNADGTNPAPFNLEGGAVFGLSADISITNSTFTGNTATEGGAILTRAGSLAINDVTFTSQSATRGGALLSFGSDTTVTDSRFTMNSADSGAAILARAGTTSVVGSTIWDNTAVTGGAGATESGGNLFFTNSTISGNRASGNGGAIFNASGFAVLTNSTVTGNLADSDGDGTGVGGGIWTASFSGTRLFNTIVAGNEVVDSLNLASRVANDLEGNVVAISSNNLIGDAASAGNLFDGTNGNIVGNAGVGTIAIGTVLDPTLASNGGSVNLTHALVPGSLAIDSGDSNRAAVPGSNGIPDVSAEGDIALVYDQRQAPHLRATGTVDIGSYEVTNEWEISTNDDVFDGSFGPGSFSLREAIETANANPGIDTLTFDIGLSRTSIELGGTEFNVTDDLVINGLGAASLTIDAGGLSRILNIAPGVTVTVTNARLTGGSTTGAGGAILNQGSLTLEDVVLDGNTANNGGALRNEGTAVIRRSLFTNNTAVFGGAIDSDAGQLPTRLENVTVSGNTATGLSGALAGGGVHVSDAVFTIVSSTIANNTSTVNGEGAGLAVDVTPGSVGTVTLVNSIVADNVSGGVGVDVAGHVAALRHSVIETDAGFTRNDITGNLFVDPGLEPLAVTNGQTATHQLSVGSPALNAGDDAEVTFGTDQTGQPRQVGSVDIGADERLLLAIDDSAGTLITNSVSIDVLSNDNPSSGTEIREIVSDGTIGSATIVGGEVTYTPDGTTTGLDSFTYAAGLAAQVESGSIDAEFGNSIAIDGDWMVIGAQSDDSLAPDGGSVFVYRRSGGSWLLFQQLGPAVLSTQDRFGFDVAIEGTTIVVGARMDDEIARNAGAAYVFEFDANQGLWLESQKLLDTVTGSEKDQFGHAVAIQGDTIVVGSRLDDGSGRNGGSILIFERSATGWTTDGRIKPDDQVQGDQFGYDVDIYGDTIAVGARKDNSGGVDSGSVYIFERDALGGWNETTEIIASNTTRNLWFGHSVSLSGDTLAVGTPQRLSRFRAGHAYVFERDVGGADIWGETILLNDPGDSPEQDNFGFAVALDGDTLAVAARRDDGVAPNAGRVYLHERDADGTNAWGITSEAADLNGEVGDNFGTAVALDGDTLVIGAPIADATSANDNSGFAHIRDLQTSTATVSVLVSAPLQATEIGTTMTADLTAQQLAPIVEEARNYWLSTPLTVAQQDALNAATVTIASLDGNLLGLEAGGAVRIDADAAGHGWHGVNGGSIDLFRTVAHELGHVIGFADIYDPAQSDDIMYGFLDAVDSDASSLDQVFGQLAADDSLYSL